MLKKLRMLSLPGPNVRNAFPSLKFYMPRGETIPGHSKNLSDGWTEKKNYPMDGPKKVFNQYIFNIQC